MLKSGVAHENIVTKTWSNISLKVATQRNFFKEDTFDLEVTFKYKVL